MLRHSSFTRRLENRGLLLGGGKIAEIHVALVTTMRRKEKMRHRYNWKKHTVLSQLLAIKIRNMQIG
jgi:hypothetical protein